MPQKGLPVWWITRSLARPWRQPALARWLEAMALFGVALVIRFYCGPLHGGMPFLSFYPAILVSALLLGWKEAVFVLVLSLSAGWYFFLPSGVLLLPAGWAFVGGLNIAIIIILKAMAEQLVRTNEQQRVLFEELQHRVANTLQVAAGRLELLKKSMASSSPAECAELLDEAIRRMSASADMHRRLHDPSLFNQGVEAMLQEVVTSVVDQSSVTLDLDVEELDLSLDQKSVIAMLVMEVANNSTKHVFQRNLGSSFKVALKRLPNQRALLTIRDDGPGIAAYDAAPSEQRLGMRIIHGLADQLHGTLTADPDQGTGVTVNIPLLHHARRS